MEDYIEGNKIFSRDFFRPSETASDRRSTLLGRPTSSEVDGASGFPMVTLKSNVRVIFHRRDLFMETFKDYFSDYELLEKSLSPEYNRDQVFKAGEGAGRSGSFFFFSHDNKFIIKTISKGELNTFLKMLPDLAEHYKKNEDSLIVKTFGAFTVKTDSTGEVHLVLMENTLQLKNKKGLQYIFDLKGSLVDRKVKGKTTPSTTLKDSNFLLAVHASKNFIDLGSDEVRRKVISVIKSDVDFLCRLGFMDYSLLIGIETLEGNDAYLDTE